MMEMVVCMAVRAVLCCLRVMAVEEQSAGGDSGVASHDTRDGEKEVEKDIEAMERNRKSIKESVCIILGAC